MSELFGLIKLIVEYGSDFPLALTALVSLPLNRMRDVLPEAFSGPFGLTDDVGTLFSGVLSARTAWKAG